MVFGTVWRSWMKPRATNTNTEIIPCVKRGVEGRGMMEGKRVSGKERWTGKRSGGW